MFKTNIPIQEIDLNRAYETKYLEEEDIKYYLAKKQIFGLDMIPQNFYNSKTRQSIDINNRTQIINYFNEMMRPLPPDELEFIPRKYWCKLEELRGAYLKNLCHPIFKIGHQIIKDNFKKNSDTILIQACGNMKPYIDNPNYLNNTLKYHRRGKCDLFVSSWNLTPIDFSPFFPWRYYEWNHKLETPFMTNQCIQNEFYNIIDIVTYFDYKKVILFGPGKPDYFYVELFRRLKLGLPNRELIFILDDERMSILNKYFKNNGLAKTRYCRCMEILKYLESQLEEDKNKICYGLKDQRQIDYINNELIMKQMSLFDFRGE